MERYIAKAVYLSSYRIKVVTASHFARLSDVCPNDVTYLLIRSITASLSKLVESQLRFLNIIGKKKRVVIFG